jgi:hypothetical protein
MRLARPHRVVIALAASALAVSPALSASAVEPFTWQQKPVAAASSFTEPSISISPDGATTVVSAPGGPGVTYWSTKDHGATFVKTTTAGGGGDSELEFLPNGHLLSADLAITTSNTNRSLDGGRTWVKTANAGGEQDRQWLAHKGSTEQYLVYHKFSTELEYFVKSTDEGATWGSETLINSPDQFVGMPNAVAKAGDTASLVDQGYNTMQGPMLVNQTTGDLFVTYAVSSAQDNATSVAGFGPTRGVVVAHSADGGTTWTNRYAAVSGGHALAGGSIGAAIFPWSTLGPDGTVYVLFNASTPDSATPAHHHFHTYFVRSTGPATDPTASWSEPVKVDGLDATTGSTVYVTGAAGGPGVLDLAWLQTDNGLSPDDGNALWHVDFAQVRDANTSEPTITRSRVSDHVIHHGSICQKGILCVSQLGDDRSLGDFFELAIGPDGRAQLAWSDNGDKSTRRVWWGAQTSGPGAFDVTASTGIPEVPTAVLLPFVAIAVIGGTAWLRRRRTDVAA